MHKIYFACSIRGGRDDTASYAAFVEHLKPRCKLLTELFADNQLTSEGTNKPSNEIWKTDTAWLKEADALIAEVSNPSLGVGYEIAKAEEWGKPILVLFRQNEGKRLSAMVAGSPALETAYYTSIEQANKAIDAFLASIDSHHTPPLQSAASHSGPDA